MEASEALQVFGAAFLLIAIAASILVRGASAVFSQRIRSSIVGHPVAHFIWLLASLLAALVLISWLGPRFSGRQSHRADQRPGVDAGQRVLFAFDRLGSGTTQAERHA